MPNVRQEGMTMPKAGDVCENCRPRWEKQGLEPKTLERAKGTTEKKRYVVTLCPWCDGDAAAISKANQSE